MADELNAPLSRRKRRTFKPNLGVLSRLPLARSGFALVVLLLGAAALRILLVNDPEGGRPSSTVPINSTRNNNPVAGQVAAVTAPPVAPATLAVGPEVPAGSGTAPQVTTVDPNLPSTLPDGDTAPGSVGKNGIYPDLAEETKDGPIPRISAKGVTPFAAYSRPLPAGDATGKPMVAIVVTGLGLSEQGTLEAIRKLPANVSLAFAPYGKTLDRTVSAARDGGHELLLEVPLEPFDYLDTDPGPQTLLTGQPPRANLDKLYWLLARFGGYVGLVNHTGARFTASAADFGPVMEELGTRGIGYLDDGTSNRSVAPQLAATNKVPFAKADAVLDANPARAPILAALDALAAKATANGGAIGVISALPVSIATITEWAASHDSHNVQLVPVSALMK
jgi:polysaccharide deacetylase 2 family uncharacterized protein YibQ